MKIVAVAAALLLSITAAAQNSDLDEAFAKDVLIIHASKHACYRLDIYLAMTGPQRTRGLMYVRNMPQTTGMLFVYESDGYLSIWMKNTYIPLDIVFVRADGSVSSIEYSAEPLSLRSIVATEPVRYVLELNAGVANKLSIDENSRLEWVPKDSGE
jgi:uncharacterized membrane protein (UPF0127 family)